MNRTVDSSLTPVDVEIANKLRPKTMEGFIGQNHIVPNLLLALNGALARGEPLDHVLFIGEPGLGKTTLARIIGGGNMIETNAGSIDKGGLGHCMTSMIFNKERCLFIDETHSLKRQVSEMLHSVMEDFVYHGQAVNGSMVSLNIPKFTFIGATTKYGKMDPPMRDRFTHVYRMKPYPPPDLARILALSKVSLNIDILDEGIVSIANRARGVPRLANRYLRIIRDWGSTIDESTVNKAFSELGINSAGLDEIDIQYLTLLMKANRPMGISTVSSYLGVTDAEVEDIIEPYLIRAGYIVKTPRGRVIDRKGIEVLTK